MKPTEGTLISTSKRKSPLARRIGWAPGSEWILHGCDFGCDSDVISDVKIYLQILHRCELDVIFASKFFSDVILGVILYHAWRESALRAPNI